MMFGEIEDQAIVVSRLKFQKINFHLTTERFTGLHRCWVVVGSIPATASFFLSRLNGQ